MKIEIERTPTVKEGVPGAALIKLLDSNDKMLGSVCIYPIAPCFVEDEERFRVEVNKGGAIGADIDIRVKI